MNKYVVLSTDENKSYWGLLPLACYSWKKLGYTPVIIHVSNYEHEKNGTNQNVYCAYVNSAVIWDISNSENNKGLKDSTLAQVARLYGYSLPFIKEDDIVILSDADMAIGKDIFTFPEKFTSYGWDLTGFGDYPICYLCGTKEQWKEIMGDESYVVPSIILNNMPEKAFSEKWELYWETDQKMITQKIKEFGTENIITVNRGHDQSNHGLPKGRWDRFAFQNIPSEIIDVHMKRNDLQAQIDVFKRLWPNDDISWLLEFHEKIKQ